MPTLVHDAVSISPILDLSAFALVVILAILTTIGAIKVFWRP